MARILQPGHDGGETHPAAKLTEDQAREILHRVASGERQKDLAEEFGVTPSCISHLVHGTSWTHLGGTEPPRPQGSSRGSSKLTEADIPVILRRVQRGESLAAVARAFKVGRTTISDIWHGRRWTHVPRPEEKRRAVWSDLY